MENCILIYDDDREILAVSKLILEHHNYQVETRASCKQIIEDIKLVKPAIIFMDLSISQMEGEDAIKLIKNNESTREIPVILFSAFDNIKEISIRSNANGYLRKPFTIAEFIDILKQNIPGGVCFLIFFLNNFPGI
ncbi:MAG: response regulator [Ginsengibacter sp.]